MWKVVKNVNSDSIRKVVEINVKTKNETNCKNLNSQDMKRCQKDLNRENLWMQEDPCGEHLFLSMVKIHTNHVNIEQSLKRLHSKLDFCKANYDWKIFQIGTTHIVVGNRIFSISGFPSPFLLTQRKMWRKFRHWGSGLLNWLKMGMLQNIIQSKIKLVAFHI